jgi:hypothetical protein
MSVELVASRFFSRGQFEAFHAVAILRGCWRLREDHVAHLHKKIKHARLVFMRKSTVVGSRRIPVP